MIPEKMLVSPARSLALGGRGTLCGFCEPIDDPVKGLWRNLRPGLEKSPGGRDEPGMALTNH
jgi:hypothetical protein